MTRKEDLKNINCRDLCKELGISWNVLRKRLIALSESAVIMFSPRALKKEALIFSDLPPTRDTIISAELHTLIVDQFNKFKKLISAKELAKKFNLYWAQRKGSFYNYVSHISKSDSDHFLDFNIFAPKNQFMFTTTKGTRFVQKYLKDCCQHTRTPFITRGNKNLKIFLLEEVITNVWTKGRVVGFCLDSQGEQSPIISAYKSTPPLQVVSENIRVSYNPLKDPDCQITTSFSKQTDKLPVLLQFDLQKDLISNKSVQDRHLLNALIGSVLLSSKMKVDIHYEGSICLLCVDYLSIPNNSYLLESHRKFQTRASEKEFLDYFGKNITQYSLIDFIKEHCVYDNCTIRYREKSSTIEGYRLNTHNLHDVELDDDLYRIATRIANTTETPVAVFLGNLIQQALIQLGARENN